MIETINNLNPEEVIESEKSRHSTAAKRNITKVRREYRLEDINIISKHFKNIKRILCVGARDDAEVKDFLNSGSFAVGIDVSNETKYIKRVDAHKLNEHFKSTDFVYSSHSLEHMYNPSKVLSNIRNLKPKGVYIVLPLQEKPASFKHPSKFQLMNIENQNDSIGKIEKQKKYIFENPENHPEIWSDFNELKPFNILEWRFRQGISAREKEVSFLLKLK